MKSYSTFPIKYPGHSILPVDPIGNDRIRRRIAPDSDAFHEKPTGTHQFYAGIFAAGFRTGLRRKRSDRCRSYPTIGSSRNSSGPIHGKRRIMPGSAEDNTRSHRNPAARSAIKLHPEKFRPVPHKPDYRLL